MGLHVPLAIFAALGGTIMVLHASGSRTRPSAEHERPVRSPSTRKVTARAIAPQPQCVGPAALEFGGLRPLRGAGDIGESFVLLSDKRIVEERDAGRIIIDPFDQRQLGTNSYDCRLGHWYFQPTKFSELIDFTDEAQERSFWGEPHYAEDAIIVKPGTTILGHTEEIVGARDGITTTMHARSSIGRSSLSVCKCAGVGDVGYVSRWTMEISNHSTCSIRIPIGIRICQIKFDFVGETLKEYHGKYGQESEWTPYDMLPRLYSDWDLGRIQAPVQVAG